MPLDKIIGHMLNFGSASANFTCLVNSKICLGAYIVYVECTTNATTSTPKDTAGYHHFIKNQPKGVGFG